MAGEVERLQELVDKYDNIVFFGGAGVSTESGIPDFRSQAMYMLMVRKKIRREPCSRRL